MTALVLHTMVPRESFDAVTAERDRLLHERRDGFEEGADAAVKSASYTFALFLHGMDELALRRLVADRMSWWMDLATAQQMAGYIPSRELRTVLVALFVHGTQENV